MPLGRLRHAEQRIDLGVDGLQRAAVAQHAEEYAGRRLAQRLLRFLPHAFRNQRVDLAARHQGAHQLQGFRRHAESERREARGKARHAQHAHRILDERLRHVAQGARVEIPTPSEGIDQRAVGGLRHRIDGQVAPREILLQRHVGTESYVKAAVSGGHLALEPRERVFLLRVGMKKDRKVAPDLAVIQVQQLLARAADDDPVALLHRKAQQGVPNRSANQIHLHG